MGKTAREPAAGCATLQRKTHRGPALCGISGPESGEGAKLLPAVRDLMAGSVRLTECRNHVHTAFARSVDFVNSFLDLRVVCTTYFYIPW